MEVVKRTVMRRSVGPVGAEESKEDILRLGWSLLREWLSPHLSGDICVLGAHMLGSRVWISGLCLRVESNTERRFTVLLVDHEGGC